MIINRKPVYLERPDIVSHREHYLQSIKKYRESVYEINYVDETWANPEQTPKRMWLFLLEGEDLQKYKHLAHEKEIMVDVDGYTGTTSLYHL